MHLPMAQQETDGTRAKACNSSHVSLEMIGDGGGHQVAGAAGTPWACGPVAAGVAALGLPGAGVLVWWAVAFHPADEQLWMVPVGLILLGTPLVAWLSIFASGACRRLDRLRAVLSEPAPPSPAVTTER